MSQRQSNNFLIIFIKGFFSLLIQSSEKMKLTLKTIWSLIRPSKLGNRKKEAIHGQQTLIVMFSEKQQEWITKCRIYFSTTISKISKLQFIFRLTIFYINNTLLGSQILVLSKRIKKTSKPRNMITYQELKIYCTILKLVNKTRR